MNGYTKNELAKRDEIARLIRDKKISEARVESYAFMLANKSRKAKRRHLLSHTVKHWNDVMSRGSIPTEPMETSAKYKVVIREEVVELRKFEVEAGSPEEAAKVASVQYLVHGKKGSWTSSTIMERQYSVDDKTFGCIEVEND